MKRALVIPVVTLALVVLAWVRAGAVAGLTLAVVSVAVLGGSAWAIYRVGQRQAALRAAATPAPAARSVKHCDCCDQACLMAKVCAPGDTPTVVHEPVS